MPTSSLIQIPAVASIFSAVGNFSGTTFNELIGFGLVLAGFLVGAYLVLLIIHGISGAIETVVRGMNHHDKYEQQ